MVGHTISHYQIIEELGRGGMGEVFLAQDQKLKRQVALKFLPKTLTVDSQARARFENEAQAAAALHHPNIVTIYDIDEHEGQVFIAMEHVEGRTLKEIMSVGTGRDLSLPIDQIISIAAQIAEGLSAAHAKGIVHRDIKPADIIINSDGVAKIVDFGLAKLKGQLQLTRSGTTLGTVAYISPEQALGQEVDPRTDIWSLGAVLYEMATGRLPFPGEYEQAMIYAILNTEPEPVTALIPKVSPELARIIGTCLAKEADKRPRSAMEIADQLKGLSGQTQVENSRPRHCGMHRKLPIAGIVVLISVLGGFILFHLLSSRRKPLDSLAVLPFINASAGSEMDYLAEGIPATLVDSLSQLANLRVKSLLTASRYLKTGMDPIDIGRKLGVAAVLTGSLHPVGNDIVISVELTSAENGDHIWGKTFQHILSEIIRLQQDLARDISLELRVKLSGEDKHTLAEQPTGNAEAYNLYLQGCHFRNIETAESLDKALLYFQKAVEKDPSLAQAWAVQSTVYLIQDFMEPNPERQSLSRAAAEKAVALAPGLPEGHVALGVVQSIYDWDWQAAEQSFRRAIALNPNLGNAHYEYGQLPARRCRNEEAEAEFKKTIELEPLWWSGYNSLGQIYTMQNKHSQAIAQYQKALEYAPPQVDFERVPGPVTFIHQSLGKEYMSIGFREQALALFNRKNIFDKIWWTAIAADQKQLYMNILEFEKELGDSTITDYMLGSIYEYLKEDEKAISKIESLSLRNPLLFYENFVFYCVSPDRARLRANPRFVALLNRAGAPKREGGVY